jgi:LicD family
VFDGWRESDTPVISSFLCLGERVHTVTNLFHIDWLRRFREDLRAGDMDSLTQHVELAGLDVVLDPDFLALAAQEDARSVVVLIATLGEANSDQPEPYRRWQACYQYLQNQLDLNEASELCAAVSHAASSYYAALLDAAKNHSPLPSMGTAPAHVTDLQFGVELLANTGHSAAVPTLLKAWQAVDRSDMPWLRTCRAVAARSPKVHARKEAAELAQTIQWLVAQAPSTQAAVAQEMRVQCADLALKARQGELACRAAEDAFAHDTGVERRFTLAKAHVLAGHLPTAVAHMHELLLHTLSDQFTPETSADPAPTSPFDLLAAEDTLVAVNRLLRAKGLKPFLMSGTLLGYARHGGILPHDKDVDLGLIGWEHQFTVAEALLEAGYFRLDLAQLSGHNRFLMSAHDLRNGMAVDFFMFHDKGDHFLHGIDFDLGFTQNFRFSQFELQEVEFLGEPFYVPADIDRNLTENYADWRTPATSYVVTVESPALCDTPESRTLLVYLEILKTLTKRMKPQRVARILDHLDATHNLVLGTDVRQRLRAWCHRQLVQPTAVSEVPA